MSVELFLEIKNEYNDNLVDTLYPFIYEGLKSIYNEAVKIAEENKKKDKIILIFQKLLQSVPNWSQVQIERETQRIVQLSGMADCFDDLVKAVVKSNIILLTYSNNISNIIAQTFYDSFQTSTLIHRCYIECAKFSHNYAFLFYHDVDPIDFKRNQMIIEQHIQSAISRGVRKILPISIILKEYLANSICLIPEPSKVELVGTSRDINKNEPKQNEQENKEKSAHKSEIKQNQVNPELKKEILEIIKTDSNHSQKERIKNLINMEKIIGDLSNRLSEKKEATSINKSVTPLTIPINFEKEVAHHHKHLKNSDREIINIDFNEETTENNAHGSVTGTTLSSKPQVNYSRVANMLVTSEKIDPMKVNLIEDYGIQGGHKKLRKR